MRTSTVSGAASLYVVATPIGNLGDMVPRAVEVLQSVSVVIAEDTRHSRRLLQHFGITTPLQAFHDHSSAREAQAIIRRLLAGESVALVTDAGTPLVSDPGYPLVTLAHQHHIPVIPIPGPCAAITALSASGLPTHHFWFEGFLPVKGAARQKRLKALSSLDATLVLYEAPHRIVALLADLESVLGGHRQGCVARELTKQFETIRNGTLADLHQWVLSDPDQQRGELVVLVGPVERGDVDAPDDEAERVLRVLLEVLPIKQAATTTARLTGVPGRRLYERALALNACDEHKS